MAKIANSFTSPTYRAGRRWHDTSIVGVTPVAFGTKVTFRRGAGNQVFNILLNRAEVELLRDLLAKRAADEAAADRARVDTGE